MKDKVMTDIQQGMIEILNNEQMEVLQRVIERALWGKQVIVLEESEEDISIKNEEMLKIFIAAKQVEGCSDKSLNYYRTTLAQMIKKIDKPIKQLTTEDLRGYLSDYHSKSRASKVTLDNIRRIISSFFSWLEEENYILKNPARRIHKIRTGNTVKETYTDEELELMRDHCQSLRDLAMIDILASTGIRVGELVALNITDVDFDRRECVVLGKGDKERKVYFDARTKIHLQRYLAQRQDSNNALFVTLNRPYNRLEISGVEIRLREMGRKLNITKVHPHKFRRTLATRAIDKGMPIEQVQVLLGHTKIDTTLQYAMVSQKNVKLSHQKYIG
ncbi:MAG: tyrosine-type recombinase/integrase [Cellulosilyticum sp.]|nr:tyrosine-type recombinase/integrase [Cellulosilyticum sp.]